jgi:non-ribosomal peptide synthetase component F
MSPSAHADGQDPNLHFAVREEDLEQPVYARFEERVRKYPNRTAVRTRNVTLTYSVLNQEANRIARGIVNRWVALLSG